MKRSYLALLILLLVVLALPGSAQFKDPGMGGGIGIGTLVPKTNLPGAQGAAYARGFLRFPLVKRIQAELGVGFGTLKGSAENNGGAYKTRVIPADVRLLLSPFPGESFNLYLYGGAGLLHYDLIDMPKQPTATKESGWTGVIPAGLGVQVALDQNISLELSGGYNMSFFEELDAVKNGKKDAYWNGLIGLTYTGESGSADPDGDGLTNKEEKTLGTDPKNPDTDADGLSDGEEMKKTNTNPKVADSDMDGLKDGDEVKVEKTDPNKADSDGDGLSDGDEVLKFKTNALKPDTDGDGLKDGEEVTKYKTDPLKADTDGDGLSDGAEVSTHRTDPLKADTDAGTVADGKEIANGTNPLDPMDDVPKPKPVLQPVEVGKAIVLDGIVFATGKGNIEPASEEILVKAYNTMAENPELAVAIHGYTDNVGKVAANKKLSLRRAESVKAWLVGKGIDGARIAVKGFGPEKPIGDNTTAEGRQMNRRIEFFRTK